MFSNQGNYVCPCCNQLIQSGMTNQQPQFQPFQPQQPQFQPYEGYRQPQFQPQEGYRQNYRENFCSMPQNQRENYDWKLPNLSVDNLPRIPNIPNMPNFQQISKNGCVIFVFAEWCGHCRNYRPTWDNIKSSNSGDYDFVEAEEGKLPDDSKLPMDLKKGNKSRDNLDNALGSVRGFPTLFFVKNGNVTEIMNRNKLMEEVKKL
jgi:thiol-disulfide isomerase/thioredoxin